MGNMCLDITRGMPSRWGVSAFFVLKIGTHGAFYMEQQGQRGNIRKGSGPPYLINDLF